MEEVVGDYKSFRDSTATQPSEEFVGNPINSFKLIKKLTSEWEMLQGLIRKSIKLQFITFCLVIQNHQIVFTWEEKGDMFEYGGKG